MAFPSAIGCFVIGESSIESGGPCVETESPTVKRTIPSYLYWQYRDDDNLQAFVDAYNTLTQEFVDWFNSLNLPVYTAAPVIGALLDWVGRGLYGLGRPVLGSGHSRLEGPYDTWAFDTLAFNTRKTISDFTGEAVDDDVYRRVISWHYFKGDRRIFNVRYLKRRIMRFLTGVNGTDPGIDQTYRISVSFGACCQVNITLVRLRSTLLRGAIYNSFAFNSRTAAIFNDVEIVTTILGPQFDLAQVLKEAIDQGVLELPFQYTYVVIVQ